MTQNSLICNFIVNHPDDWRLQMKEKNILVKDDGIYSIFNYGIKAKFSDPIAREARGIIIDRTSLTVVCWPFNKFMEYDEYYADEIDWASARVQEKIDGNIVKLWYSKKYDIWVWSTNSVIYAKNAPTSTKLTGGDPATFEDVIKSTELYNVLQKDLSVLNKDYTYIFELTSKETEVIIHRNGNTVLYHIGTRSAVTGEEFRTDSTLPIDHLLSYVPRPRQYPLCTLEECLFVAEHVLNKHNNLNVVQNCIEEGFVVVDDNWNRVKIKSPIYLILHDVSSNSTTSKEYLIKMIHTRSIDITKICSRFPDVAKNVLYYAYKYHEIVDEITKFVDAGKALYDANGKDRKVLGKLLNNHKYSVFVFKTIDAIDKNEPTPSIFDIMSEFSGGLYHSLGRYIPNYECPKEYCKLGIREKNHK